MFHYASLANGVLASEGVCRTPKVDKRRTEGGPTIHFDHLVDDL